MSEYKPATSKIVVAVITEALIETSLSIEPPSISTKVGETTTFNGMLATTGDNVVPIAGKTIHLYIDNVDTGKSAITDARGNYSITVTWTKVGTFNCDTRYLGD